MQNFTTYYTSPIGLLKVQCNEEHLTALTFAEKKEQADFSNAITDLTCQQLDEYFRGDRQHFQIPLLQTGTQFQEKVWNLLYTIPYGKTISYQTLAQQYGDVKAIRAVAAANGKNNLAIIIPCHRVIGSNATLTGYAGGLWRKKWLLEHETKHSPGVQQLSLL